ncbi:hypothetical protein Taro_041619 [Colocasia esculenta]|uniref:Uncharacterized protein n=1 Tax=Colocasia esculenta TaxID=4460 RepID=A0A843WGB6_COLES|nr:hypothetical protein [Colocasia esculenta]
MSAAWRALGGLLTSAMRRRWPSPSRSGRDGRVGQIEPSKLCLAKGRSFRVDFERFDILVSFLAWSCHEDVLQSGGNAGVSPFFTFFAKLAWFVWGIRRWVPSFRVSFVKATDQGVAFRTRQLDPSHSASEGDISRRRVLKAIVDPVAFMILRLSDYRYVLCTVKVSGALAHVELEEQRCSHGLCVRGE